MRPYAGTVFLLLMLVSIGAVVARRAISNDSSAATTSVAGGAPARVAVEVAPIESGLMRAIRVLSGTLEASTRFDVAAKVGGLIRRINVDLGDEVRRGQIVAQLDDEEFVQAVAQAKAELAVRKAELARARSELGRVTRDFARVQGLHERGVASELEFSEMTAQKESQEAAVALAEARVRQAEAAMEVASIQLGYTTVRASWERGPDRATVGMRYRDPGDTIQAGGLIVAVVGLDPLTAVVSVTEGDYARIVVGQHATLTTDARPGEVFDAQVARIAPVFREASRQARIELQVDNADRKLRPGMFIRVRVVLREAHADTIVPAPAIVQRGGGNVVFTLDAGGDAVSQHVVELGIVRGERVQIVRPKLTGRVVVLGQHLLEDGSPVTITE